MTLSHNVEEQVLEACVGREQPVIKGQLLAPTLRLEHLRDAVGRDTIDNLFAIEETTKREYSGRSHI
jgi:hypothetical protein